MWLWMTPCPAECLYGTGGGKDLEGKVEIGWEGNSYILVPLVMGEFNVKKTTDWQYRTRVVFLGTILAYSTSS